MNEPQLEESNRLHDFFRDYILTNYKIRTTIKHSAKKTNGYSLRRVCITKCPSNWYLNVNIFNGECSLTCKKMCSHLYVEKPSD